MPIHMGFLYTGDLTIKGGKYIIVKKQLKGGKVVKPEYSEYEVDTTTHLTRAIQQRVEGRIATAIGEGKTPSEAQVESWINLEWEKAKQAIAYWEEVRKRRREAIKSLKVAERVLRRIRDNKPQIPDTLDMSAYSDDWKRIKKEEIRL